MNYRSPMWNVLYGSLLVFLQLAVSPAPIAALEAHPSSSAAIEVTTTNDKLNVNWGTVKITDLTSLNKISLREAVCAANNITGPDAINLPKGIYSFSLGGSGENLNKECDLDINDNLTIIGGESILMGRLSITG